MPMHLFAIETQLEEGRKESNSLHNKKTLQGGGNQSFIKKKRVVPSSNMEKNKALKLAR
jgi:hypothetical protein